MHDKLFSFGMTEIEIAGNSRFFVADGVGGMPAGDVASNYVLTEINQRFGLNAFPEKDQILKTLIEINSGLLKYAQSDLNMKGMATTLSGVFFGENQYRIVNAGDSKVFQFRKGKLTQLTLDDVMDFSESYKPITSYFGGLQHEIVSPFISEAGELLENDDIYIITTDGLAHCFSNDQLAMVLSNSKPLAENVKFILHKSLAIGSPDNITCIFVRVSQVKNH